MANSNKVGSGDLLYAGEFNFYNGVWQQPEDSKKFNGMLRYTLNKNNWGLSVNAKGYTNSWTATNQIPQASIDNGTLGFMAPWIRPTAATPTATVFQPIFGTKVITGKMTPIFMRFTMM